MGTVGDEQCGKISLRFCLVLFPVMIRFAWFLVGKGGQWSRTRY